jgi:hypothetical protein
MRTVAGLAMQLQRPAIVLALGDHPPPVPFTPNPKRSMDVPFFALSNDPDILAKFELLTPGLIAPIDAPAVSTRLFLPWLLTQFENADPDDQTTPVRPPSDGK